MPLEATLPLLTFASLPFYEAFGQREGDSLFRDPVRVLFAEDHDRWNNSPDEDLLKT